MSVETLSPVGRIVWGSPTKQRDVIDTQTKTVRVDKDGNKRKQISFGIAIPKADWMTAQVGPNGEQFLSINDAMAAAANELFPGGIPGNFAWKFKDGDTHVDNNGKPSREKEGWAGCYILSCSTELVSSVGVFGFDHGAGKWAPTKDIKAGDYAKVTLNFNAHKARNNTEKPGLYVNPNAVMLWAVGPEIKGAYEFDPNARGFAPPPPQAPPAGAAVPGAPTPSPTPQHAPAAPPAPATANPHQAFLRGPTPDAS